MPLDEIDRRDEQDDALALKKVPPLMLTCPVCGGDKKSRIKAGERCVACNDDGQVSDKHR
jgi:ssDNA-binding Zn-finger/Zn-ribbon topoisomerase 1